MASTIIFTSNARRALIRIAVYISQDDEAAAYRLVADLEKRVNETLSLFPDAGSRAPGGQRQFFIRRHTFLYRHDAAKRQIMVLNVFGPGEDWR